MKGVRGQIAGRFMSQPRSTAHPDYSCIASSRLARNAGSAIATSSASAANRKAAKIGRLINNRRITERDHHRAAQVLFHHRAENKAEHHGDGLAVELEQDVAHRRQRGERIDVEDLVVDAIGANAAEHEDRGKTAIDRGPRAA
jgi:hypothetical protein